MTSNEHQGLLDRRAQAGTAARQVDVSPLTRTTVRDDWPDLMQRSATYLLIKDILQILLEKCPEVGLHLVRCCRHVSPVNTRSGTDGVEAPPHYHTSTRHE